MYTEIMEEIADDYYRFSENLFNKNRFFNDDLFLKKIESLSQKNSLIIEKGSNLFRARIMSDIKASVNGVSRDGINQLFDMGLISVNATGDEITRQLEKIGVWGYNEKNSGLPPKEKTPDGRLNPKYIPYLYTAKSKYTALIESKPYMGENVSIATYTLRKDIKIFDVTQIQENAQLSDYENGLISFLNIIFSKPMRDGDKEYLSTQCLTEYIKIIGFDGICFRSSLHRNGQNVVLYKSNVCRFTGSEVYRIKNIVFETEPKAPLRNADITPYEFKR